MTGLVTSGAADSNQAVLFKPEVLQFLSDWHLTAPEQDVPQTLRTINDLTLARFLTRQTYDDAEAICRRGVEERANLGLQDAVWSVEHQRDIRWDLRRNIIVFSGTKLRDSAGNFCLPAIICCDVRWELVVAWQLSGFNDVYRLAGHRSQL